MKVSEIPTDTFAAELSDSRLDDLESIILESLNGNMKRLSDLRLQCSLEQCRRGKRPSKPKPVRTPEEQEDELRRGLHRYGVIYRLRQICLVKPCASRGRGKNKILSKVDQETFNAAADMALGVTSHFPSLAITACTNGDADFFRVAAKALDAVKSPRKNEAKITRHVRMALMLYINIENRTKRIPTRWEIRESIESLDHDYYEEESDWNHVWKEAELDFLEVGKRGALIVKRRRNACGSSD